MRLTFACLRAIVLNRRGKNACTAKVSGILWIANSGKSCNCELARDFALRHELLSRHTRIG